MNTSNLRHLMISLAIIGALGTGSTALVMGSINIDLQTIELDTDRDPLRRALGTETFIQLTAPKLTETAVMETASFRGKLYPNPGSVSVDVSIIHPDGTLLGA